MEEETLRGRKHHTQDERAQIEQHGGDELESAHRAGHSPESKDPKEKLGVDEQHKTDTMRRQHRGTFP